MTIPTRLITDLRGNNPRLRVDPGSTGFFAGREFRTFKEFDVATTATYVVKIAVPVDVILTEFQAQSEQGSMRVETVLGGTGEVEGGTFSETLPIRAVNTMSERLVPNYSPLVVMTAGGTLTGGLVIDVSRIKVSNNANFSATVGGTGGSDRGVGAGTYYWRITMTDYIGVVKARWEERI